MGAYLLPNPVARVQLPAFPQKIQATKIDDFAEVSQRRRLEESG